MSQYYGEIFAITTAFCWSVTSMSFESAGKKVGSLSVNFIRLVMALFLIGFFNFFRGMNFLPTGLDYTAWLYLGISGIIGFALGDLFLFQAFVEIGARISMLIMSLVPLVTTALGLLFLGEMPGVFQWIGMMLTISGVAGVILFRKRNIEISERPSNLLKGCILALGGAVGQSAGLIFSKLGMRNYDAFTSTQIRIIAGIIGFILILSAGSRWHRVAHAVANGAAMLRITTGAFFGPFLGVSFSLLALQYTSAGTTATLNSIVPVIIIPPAVILFKEKINRYEIFGTVIAVTGVGLMFL